MYQLAYLSKTVSEARDEQQQAIRSVSEDTMGEVLEASMTRTTAMQAYIAEDMFSNIKCDVMTLQTIAQEMFDRENTVRAPFSLPNADDDGEYTAQVLFEDGVDPAQSEYIMRRRSFEGAYKNTCIGRKSRNGNKLCCRSA